MWYEPVQTKKPVQCKRNQQRIQSAILASTSQSNPSRLDPLKASGRILASKLHQRDTDVVGVELPSHVGKKSCMKISSGRPAWMSSPAYLRTYCTFFEKTFWQPSRILVFQRENEVLESSSIKMNKRQYPELPFCIMQGFLFISQKLKKSLEEVGCTNFYVTEVVHILRNKELPFPIKIGQVEKFNRATPGSSLVANIT